MTSCKVIISLGLAVLDLSKSRVIWNGPITASTKSLGAVLPWGNGDLGGIDLKKIEDPILCVIDGGKGIRKALRDVLGHLGVIQRCTVHKRRNIREHLPKHRQNSIDRQIRDAYASKTAETARKRLRQVGTWLARNGEESAAESLKEGLEETLTVIKLGLPDILRKFFSTTNAIENLMGRIRKVTRNVKRWRSDQMARRWVTAAIDRARDRFHNIKGHKSIPVLVAALRVHAKTLDLQGQVS